MDKYIKDVSGMLIGVGLSVAGVGKCADSLSDEGIEKLKEIVYNVAPNLLNNVTKQITDFFNNNK